MESSAHKLLLTGDTAMHAFGHVLATKILPGHIVLLEGDLGAGKTTLARTIIRHLMGEPDLEVPSPSFALVQPYEGKNLTIIHTDLYRLADESELDELGILDDEHAIILVEWPERAPGLCARADLRVQLDMADKGLARTALVSSPSRKIDISSL